MCIRTWATSLNSIKNVKRVIEQLLYKSFGYYTADEKTKPSLTVYPNYLIVIKLLK